MLQPRHFFVFLLPLVNAAVWIAFPPVDHGLQPSFSERYLGEVIGSTMMIMMAFTLLLATRIRVLERLLGGLDKLYVVHRNAGIFVFLLLFLHLLVMPLNPNEVPPGRAPGYIAFGGFVLLILLSLAPRIPGVRRVVRIGYRGWRIWHRFIGVFFIIGTAHSLLVDPLVRTTTVPFTLLMIAIVVGITSYLYTELIARFVRRRAGYKVREVRQLSAGAVEVTLVPEKKRLSFEAGQFLFIRFRRDKVLSEWHPFTVSSSPKESGLRLTIRSAGDYTDFLSRNLKSGARAVVEGGYGTMDYRKGGMNQIWIAGGIGVTPFLSWMRDMPEHLPHRIDFVYTVRTEEEALFLSEIVDIARRHDYFKVHVHYSAEQGRLTAEHVVGMMQGEMAGKRIYMCGPAPMLAAFRQDFRRRGVPAGSIHFEQFRFR
ncbi:ferric reductase-like transmembrane domain-containing protein [Paenibacillus lignilyticus]|uniref:Ferric reductase-like transmembrane domain-containing protein n=1 Tax=Paenibacillus lignilyticus TaxID=1172615 RepID=A0ABS5CJK7_9BACL|nr:ferric reductase-like transmembrane domain-containing protein [Paenibacillus lignilyticus]MBP3966023.1 ferric reductase-like transmembrane domain-containing protein [Paenibacillus lignilyticus]